MGKDINHIEDKEASAVTSADTEHAVRERVSLTKPQFTPSSFPLQANNILNLNVISFESIKYINRTSNEIKHIVLTNTLFLALSFASLG